MASLAPAAYYREPFLPILTSDRLKLFCVLDVQDVDLGENALTTATQRSKQKKLNTKKKKKRRRKRGARRDDDEMDEKEALAHQAAVEKEDQIRSATKEGDGKGRKWKLRSSILG